MSNGFKVTIEDKIKAYSSERVYDDFKKEGKDVTDFEILKDTNNDPVTMRKKAKAANKIFEDRCKEVRQLFDANGRDQDGYKVELKDALNTGDAQIIFPKVLQQVAIEAQEPLLIASRLCQTIPYKPGIQIYMPSVIGAIGGVSAIPEGGEYPEVSITQGGGMSFSTIGKFGLALKFTDELVRYSQYDMVSQAAAAVGKAFARHKEETIFNMVSNEGKVLFDNVSPSTSLFGVTTGRNLEGAANGSITMDDLYKAYTQMLVEGRVPDTLLVHPLTFMMFVQDPMMRHLFLSGRSNVYFASYNGSPANMSLSGAIPANGMGLPSGTNILPAFSGLEKYDQTLQTAPVLPGYFPYPLNVIVSPFMPHDPVNNLTEMYLFQSGMLGFILEDEALTMEDWRDPAHDITKMKWRERWNLAVAEMGQGLGVLKNISTEPNRVVLPAYTTIEAGSGASITEIDSQTPIFQ